MKRSDMWTEDQLNELRRLCPQFTDEVVAEKIALLRPGVTGPAVAWQRRILGIPKKKGGPHHRGKAVVSAKRCLGCGHDFGSTGPFNRVCDACKIKNANVAA